MFRVTTTDCLTRFHGDVAVVVAARSASQTRFSALSPPKLRLWLLVLPPLLARWSLSVVAGHHHCWNRRLQRLGDDGRTASLSCCQKNQEWPSCSRHRLKAKHIHTHTRTHLSICRSICQRTHSQNTLCFNRCTATTCKDYRRTQPGSNFVRKSIDNTKRRTATDAKIDWLSCTPTDRRKPSDHHQPTTIRPTNSTSSNTPPSPAACTTS